jgi:hypothetical protein
MTNTSPAYFQGPSVRRILLATAVAALVAAVVVVTAVLPAEFGVDPLGTGKATGLLDLYQASSGAEIEVEPIAESADAEGAPRPRIYKVEKADFTLGPGQGFEYKYRLAKGESMVYAWKTTTRVNYEFHGEPQDRTQPVQSYEKSASDYGSGGLTAGFTGIHGWFWENPSQEEITITMTSAGYYTGGVEFRPSFDQAKMRATTKQIPHELQDAE